MKPLLYGPTGQPLRVKAHYEGATTARIRSAVPGTNRSVHLDLNRLTRRELMRKSRYFYKNSPFVRGLIERLVTYVVGTGLVPIPETSSEPFNTKAMEEWMEWCKRCDLQNNHHMATLQGVIFRGQLIDGDHFTLNTHGRSGRPRIQLIESHQIGADYDHGDRLIEGVELDEYGRPVVYRYRNETPVHWIADPGFDSIDAEDLIAHFTPLRAGQVRGEPILSSAVNTVHDVDDILALEKAAVKDASSKTDVIKTIDGELNRAQGDYIGSSLKTSTGDDLEKYYTSIFSPEAKVLRQGDDYKPYIPQRPSNAWQGFMDFLAQTVCLSIGMPASVLLQMKVGGADTRRDLAVAQRVIERYQQALSQQLQRVYNYWIEFEVEAGYLSGAPKDFKKCSWQYPKELTADAGRDAAQEREDIKGGLLSLREYYGRYNMHWKSEINQIVEEQAYVKERAERRGLTRAEVMLKDPNELSASQEAGPDLEEVEAYRPDQRRVPKSQPGAGRFVKERHTYGKSFSQLNPNLTPNFEGGVSSKRIRQIKKHLEKSFPGKDPEKEFETYMASLKVKNPRKADDVIGSTEGFNAEDRALLKKTVQEMLDILPPNVAQRIPKIDFKGTPYRGGSYDGKKTIQVDTRIHPDKAVVRSHMMHEFMHAIHANGPDSYIATIARHYRVRTANEPDIPGVRQEKEDQWIRRQIVEDKYSGLKYHWEAKGAGIELPSSYFQQTAFPTRWRTQSVQRSNGTMEMKKVHRFMEDPDTFAKVMSVFYHGRRIKE